MIIKIQRDFDNRSVRTNIQVDVCGSMRKRFFIVSDAMEILSERASDCLEDSFGRLAKNRNKIQHRIRVTQVFFFRLVTQWKCHLCWRVIKLTLTVIQRLHFPFFCGLMETIFKIERYIRDPFIRLKETIVLRIESMKILFV